MKKRTAEIPASKMQNPDQRMIQVQAELISKLNQQIKDLKNRADIFEQKYEQNRKAAHFYMELQEQIKESEMLQSEWTRFLMFLKMTDANDETFSE